MDIRKVNPVNDIYTYWLKFKPYAHSVLNNYTKEDEAHEQINSQLWFILKNLDVNNIHAESYIKTCIKRMVRRLKETFGYKYNKNKLYFVPLDENIQTPVFDMMLDDYLISNNLLKFINRLPKREREVIKRYYGLDNYKELYLKDIAKILNVSANTARMIKERGLQRLRSWIINRDLHMEDFINE